MRQELVWRASIYNLAPHVDGSPQADEDVWGDVRQWTERLGVQKSTAFAVFRAEDGGYRLHVTELVLDDAGTPIWDHASDCAATTYRVLSLGAEADWPQHFNDPHYAAKAGCWL